MLSQVKLYLMELMINVHNGTFTWVEIMKIIPKVVSQDLKLVISNNQLFMVDFVPENI